MPLKLVLSAPPALMTTTISQTFQVLGDPRLELAQPQMLRTSRHSLVLRARLQALERPRMLATSLHSVT